MLGSSYATFLGVPVAGWALASYVATAGLAFALLRGASAMLPRIASAFIALTGAMLAVSVYFFVVSTHVIGVACPMCLSLDATSPCSRPRSPSDGLRRSSPPLASAPAAGARRRRDPRADPVVARAMRPAARPIDRIGAMIRFYARYISQPVTEAPLGEGVAGGGDVTVVEFSDFSVPTVGAPTST